MCQRYAFPVHIVCIGKCKQPVGQTGKGFYGSMLHCAGGSNMLLVNTLILLKAILNLLRCAKQHMTIPITDISTINNTPVTIAGYLAAYAPPTVGKHQPGCNCIGYMYKRNFITTAIKINTG